MATVKSENSTSLPPPSCSRLLCYSFRMSGLLSNHPLAELILEISDAHLSGVLRLSRGRAKGAIYFDDGQTTGALTNIRAYRMVEALRRDGAIASERLDVIVKPEMPDDAAGAALVAAGLISNDDLTRLRERLAFEVLRQLLQWEDGEWVFDARVRVGETQRVRLETSHLLLENARRLAPAYPRRVPGCGREAFPTVAENVGGAGDELQLQPAEAFVMSRFDTPLKVGEIVAISGLPEQEREKRSTCSCLAVSFAASDWRVCCPTRRPRRLRPRPPALVHQLTQ